MIQEHVIELFNRLRHYGLTDYPSLTLAPVEFWRAVTEMANELDGEMDEAFNVGVGLGDGTATISLPEEL